MATLLLLSALFILLVPLVVYFLWPRLVFSPKYYEERDAFHRHPEHFHPLELLRDQNVVLEGIVYTPDAPECTVVYFGGREQDSVALVGKLSERFARWRIVAFNYRGYGRSGGGPSGKKVLEDAVAVVRYAMERFGPVTLMGYSLGSSVAAYAASRTRPQGLILVAPFYSLHALAKRTVPMLPEWMVRCRFDTARYLSDVDASVFIFASRDDTLVPIEQSRALEAKAHRLSLYKEYSGLDHDEILGSDVFVSDILRVPQKILFGS